MIKNNTFWASHKSVERFIAETLRTMGVDLVVRGHVTTALIQTSVRGIDSHGVRLFPHYVRAIEAGRLNPKPRFRFKKTAYATGIFDGDHTFGHAAGGEAMGKALTLAEASGIGAVSVIHSSHFGAAAYYALLAADKNFIGIGMTHADALLLTHNGKRAYFGTNPIAFAAPCQNEEPFCLDMATSQVPWNKILQHREHHDSLETGWAADKSGIETTNPDDAGSVLPIGRYKGFGLAMMIDIFCGVLTGMPFGRDILPMFTSPLDAKRNLGHFFIAIDIKRFIPLNTFKERLQKMMNEVRAEPPKHQDAKVMVAGDPEKTTQNQRAKAGLPITERTMKEFEDISRKYKVEPLTKLEESIG